MESAGFEAGNYARITLNDVEVPVNKKNLNGTDRGLHVVILDTSTMEVVQQEVFDTHETSTVLELYISRGVPPEGFIIIAACKDDIAKELSVES